MLAFIDGVGRNSIAVTNVTDVTLAPSKASSVTSVTSVTGVKLGAPRMAESATPTHQKEARQGRLGGLLVPTRNGWLHGRK